ncbi:MAG: DUF427 domain-containing protein [Euryarchaeota archaeon]|nr:DUF427 domain-containing protein [Euryarchaeota archaeon]
MAQTTQFRYSEVARVAPTPKRVRARVGGAFVADSKNAILVYNQHFPFAYAFPKEDTRADLFTFGPAGGDGDSEETRRGALKVDGRTIEGAATLHTAGRLEDHVVLDWNKMDDWYEEDEPVFVHPHDPGHRIDIRQSDRHVVIEIDGTTVADSRRPVLLFETGLPVRHYLPHTDVRLGLLRTSDKTTGCAYKGFASYHHVEVDGKRHEDIVWSYRSPFHEALKIQGLMAFFDERIDVIVDDEEQERPDTMWNE